MSGKYTPGPWGEREYFGRHRRGCGRAITALSPAVEIAYIQGPASDEEIIATSRLMAAAPDMAELLLSAYQHVSHGGPTRGEVEDVLKKAGVL